MVANISQAEPLRKVLVTGGAGYIGSHIVLCLLLTRRYKVISIDNHHNSYPQALVRVQSIAKDALPSDPSPKDIESTQVDAWSADLTDPAAITKVFEKYGQGGIWGVIHVAAYKAVGESSEIPIAYYANNVAATVSLADIMSKFDCNRMVYSSSATVYGTPPIIPIPETTPLKADSVYGRTKVMCETILQDICHSRPDSWRVISLRYFNPAGAHPSGRIGEDPRGRPGNLLPLLSQMAIGRVKESELKVFGDDFPTPDGTCVRDYLHVMDLAGGHLLALDALESSTHPAFQNLPDRAKYKAYNLGKGRGQSVYDIVNAMRKATGVNYRTRVIGRRLGDVPDLTADPSLAEKELGFHAEQDLETMCRDLWNWQTKNPEGYATPEPGSSLTSASLQTLTATTVSSTKATEADNVTEASSHEDWVNVPVQSNGTPSSTVIEEGENTSESLSTSSLQGSPSSVHHNKLPSDQDPRVSLAGTLNTDPPTIPHEKEIFDPSTPSYLMTPVGSTDTSPVKPHVISDVFARLPSGPDQL